jgi:hypothetical protein
MKTPTELIDDLKRALNPMDDDCTAIFEYSSLLGVLMAGPDAETAMDGTHQLMLDIRARADNLRRLHDDATQAVQRLANP